MTAPKRQSKIRAAGRSVASYYNSLPPSKRLKFYVGIVLALIGCAIQIFAQWHASQNLFWAVPIGISLQLAFTILLPTTFKDHIMVEVLTEHMGITLVQFLIGISLMAFGLGYELDIISRVVTAWVTTNPDAVILNTHLAILFTLILPGYFIIIISEAEISEDKRIAQQSQLMDHDMRVVAAQTKYIEGMTDAKLRILGVVEQKLLEAKIPSDQLGDLTTRVLGLNATQQLPSPQNRQLPADQVLSDMLTGRAADRIKALGDGSQPTTENTDG